MKIREAARRKRHQRPLGADIELGDVGLATIDLGASIGAVGSQIAKQLSQNTTLISVEGNPYLSECLRNNMSNNASHLNCEVVDAAIAYGVKTIRFSVENDNLCSANSGSESSQRVEVTAIGLSDILSRFEIEQYQLVCDIEGAELQIVRNDPESLRNCSQIIIELHGVREDGILVLPEEVLSMLYSLGFELIDRYGPVAVLRRNIF